MRSALGLLAAMACLVLLPATAGAHSVQVRDCGSTTPDADDGLIGSVVGSYPRSDASVDLSSLPTINTVVKAVVKDEDGNQMVCKNIDVEVVAPR